jgi:hypothetical protein
MEIIKYIYDCLRPRGNDEWINTDKFYGDVFMNMKQDGIYVSKERPYGINKGSIEYVSIGDYYISRRVIREIAWLKEDGSYEWDRSDNSLYRRLVPPPIETLNHTHIIKSIINEYKGRETIYLEYGVRDGGNFIEMSNIVKKAYGVDMIIKDNIRVNNNIELYEMMTNEFRDKRLPWKENMDVVFIDADHSSLSVISDFNGVYMKVNKGGYIILHDTYPCNEELLSPGGCNDCYKTPMYLKNVYRDNIEILTLPLNPGLTIVRKC